MIKVMSHQHIYTVEDRVYCPEGSGEVVITYLDGLFARIAPQVVRVRRPVDWLIVKSDNLGDVTFGSQDFFEGRLEKALREHNAQISVITGHSHGVGGALSNIDVENWIREILQDKEVTFTYLNPLFLETMFVGYHLSRPT